MSRRSGSRVVSVSLDPAVYAELVVTAEEHGISLSQVIQGALVRELRRAGRPIPEELERRAWWLTDDARSRRS